MIYVHIPFCRSFCTYCDFYSEVASRCRKAEDAAAQDALFGEFAEALCAEAAARAREISDDVNTLYIGGGTPSVLPLSAFRRIVAASGVCRRPFEEFTVEVNPEDIVEKGHAYVEGLLELGVNRISMGVQSFDDSILKFMNRRHSAAEAVRAYAILEEAGVRNISIDLIFGLPQLSASLWRETLEKALGISSRGVLPQHISSYQLSVEPGSMLARLVERGVWSEAPEDICQEQYSILCETLSSVGYNHYEISNFARPGYEAVHNSAYWSHVPYIGLGPGAHSFVSRHSGLTSPAAPPSPSFFPTRQWNRPDLQAYMAAARAGDFSSVRESETLTQDQIDLEHIMLGLRTSAGLPADYLCSRCDPESLAKALALGHLVPVSGLQLTSSDPARPVCPVCPESLPADTWLRIPERHFFISDTIISSLV